MKFIVERASLWSDDSSPCEEAKREQLFSQEEFVWTIDINTIKQLVDFIEKYGEIIIKDYTENEGILTITIYDDYIE